MNLLFVVDLFNKFFTKFILNTKLQNQYFTF